MKNLLIVLLGAFTVTLSPGIASADGTSESVLVVRTLDDPGISPDLGVCANAPFATNAALGASVWSIGVKRRTGVVKRQFRKRIGTATACLQLPGLDISAGDTAPLFGNFLLADGEYLLDGSCVVTATNLPAPGLLLAGCTAEVIDAPGIFVGGIATSNTVFSLLPDAPVSTGSLWTLRVFREHGYRWWH